MDICKLPRNYQTAYQPTVTKFKSNLANLPDEPLYKSVSLVPQAWGNSIAVFNTTNPTDVINTSQVGSPDLLLAKIPVGIAAAGTSGGPRYVAATSDGTVAYTPLESQGRVAVVDLLALQQVNTNRGASDPTIALPTGAQPFSIVIDHLDRYAYVADRRPANGVGKIYVIDINPNSATYNKHIKTISIGTNLVELAQMAVSADGKSLFITAPKATDSQGHVLVVNIDASRKNAPSSQWQKQVADIVTKQGVTGVAVAPLDANHPERVQMAITNRQQDFNGFGVITIDNGNFAQAQTTYTKLSLGSVYDYFDVNEAFSTTITQDGKYAFVAARNTANLAALIPSVDADNRAGSNIGIIKDPLTSNAKLIAATLPIPMGWTIGLALSGDDKVLTAAYQGLGPSPGTVFMFNVDEIIRTIEHPEQFYIADPRGENEKSPNLRPHVASLDDFQYYAIDAINPAIGQIAADLYRTGSGQQIDFIVPEGSKTPPIYIGNNTYSVTNTSDWLDLDAVTPVGYTEDLTPTLNWHFANAANVQEVNLFVSTFDQGEGLLPWDELVNLDDSTFLPNLSRQQKENLLSKDWHGYHDYNPGRTLTATWKKNTNSWYWADGTVITQNASSSSNTTFTLPDVVSLATGTNYHWAVQASDNSGRIIVEKGDFDTVAPLGNSPFSSVSILTQGFTQDPTPTGVSDWVYGVGNAIINSTGTAAGRHGLLLLFEKRTGTWLPVDSEGKELTLLTGGLSPRDPNYLSTLAANIKTYYQHKPLVLMSEWSLGRESVVVDSGFSEGAADDIFAAMVHLDQALGGGVGNQAGEIYDQQGRLIVTQGDLFNSPLHFIGHSRGTVVTSEIVQRTYFPGAGGRILLDAQGNVIDNPDRDLQMTTLDPHDFRQPSLANFQDFYEPKIQIWDNITFADNYYQTLGFENGATFTPNGRDIPNLPSAETNRNPQPAGLNFLRDAQGRLLGQPDFSLNMNNLTGFFLNPDNQSGAPHSEVVNWYEGTVDLNLDSSGGLDGRISDTPGDLIKTIYDRLGEREVNDLLGTATSIIPWFKREGAGQGWYYSVLGGGKAARPHSNVAKVPVSWDNTLEARLRGDFAVPTLFNGNFNASFESPPSVLNPVSSSTFRNFAPKVGSTAVPGWSFRNNVSGATWNDNAASTWNLVDWKDIPTFAQPNGYLSKLGIDPSANTYQPDYAIKLDSTNNTITHNRFLIPDWGSLRFDLFTGAITSPMAGTLKVFLDALDGSTATKIDEIYLERAVGTGAQYERDTHKIGYGELGFETFTVDIPDAWRGKVGTLRFELDNSTQPIYLDNMFFKSQPLLLGNPTVARNQDTLSSGINNYENNYLIEKSQFAISYSKDDNIPNWSAWELNKSWIGTEDRRVPFFGDPALQNQGWIQVTDSDYKRDYGIEYGNPGYVPKSDLPQINPEPDSNGVIKPYKLAPGHLSPVLHRSRIRKDVTSTFLSTNVVPQFDKLNSPVWSGIEDFERNLVDRNANNRELYIYSGSVGTKQDKPSINITDKSAPYNIRVPEALWRVIVVMDRPGLGIADINSSNTHAFALIASNELPTPGQTPFDPWYINGNIILTSVSDLEEYLNNDLTNEARSITYNFLSNLPTNVRNAIKSQTFPILPSNGNPVNAFLLAETSPSEVITNAAIWHDRVLENVAIETVNFFELDSSQVGIAQNIIPEQSPFEIGSHQISLSQIATTDFSIPKFSINQGGVSQVDTEHGSVRKSSPSQISPTEVSSIQTNGIELSSNQNSTAQVDSFHVGVIQVQSTKVDITKVGLSDTITKVSQPRPTEIPLTSSITLQQFLSSHNFDLQNRTVPLWTEFLQSPTPFNLKVETTDLPTGQLAEGTITGYDTNGRPNSGTITLDINGNNQGWFIDTTPGDNSEFDEQLTETAYQATNSPATGRAPVPRRGSAEEKAGPLEK